MTRLAQITREYRDAGATSDLIPLYGFVDDGVFLTKSGALGIVLALDGVDYECLDPQQREAVTTRFEVALRLWDERTRLSQYVLKRNRVARPDDAHPHPAVDTLLRRRHAYLHAQQADLFTVSLYLVVVVDPDRPAAAWASRARRALRQPVAASREWFSTARTVVRLDDDLERRRVQLRHKVDAFVQQLEDTVAPTRAGEGRGLHVLPASPELHAGEGGRCPTAPGHLSRLRHLRFGARMSPHAPASRRPLRPRAHAEGTAGAHVSAAVSGAVRDSVESRARERLAAGRAGRGPSGDSREAPAFPQRQGESHQLRAPTRARPQRTCSSTTARPPSCGTSARP